MSVPELRSAEKSDAHCIAGAEAACFGDAAWTQTQVHSELIRAGAVALVLCEDDGLLGYALGWSLAGEGELLRIAVVPAARGAGHGATLLEAFHRATHADALFLEVDANNAAARSLYARHGWREVGVRRAYYRHGGDAILMTKRVE